MRRFASIALGVGLTLAACDRAPDPADGGSDAGLCTSDDQCVTRDFCAGRGVCMAGSCLVLPRCIEHQSCDAARRTCVTDCAVTRDADGDGAIALECGGTDCDDQDPSRFPGAPEVCDVRDHDEDCDPSTFGYRDEDGDGVPDQRCCNVDADGTRSCGSDCDDARPAVSPLAGEICNGLDDDCDASLDEGVLQSYWPDVDRDGYGTSDARAMARMTCTRPDGYAPTHDDCNDDVAAINPAAVEICDAAMRDEDCSGVGNDVPGGCDCTEPDARTCPGLLGRCMGATQSCMGGAWGPCSVAPVDETCNAIDDDCDGNVDEGQTVTCYVDGDNDGYALYGATPVEQCPDPSRAMAPFARCPLFHTARAPVTPDLDSDCDDSAMALALPTRCYRDGDGDTYGAGAVAYRCPGMCGSGWVTNTSDCCDSDAQARPHQTSYFPRADGCGSFDYNCDGVETHLYGSFDCRYFLSACTVSSPGFSGPLPSCGGGGNLDDTCTMTAPGRCAAGGGPVGITVQQCQ